MADDKKIIVLVSGGGTNLQALIDAQNRAAAVEPQSYAFSLGITDGDSAEIIWSVLAAFGEEYDENSHFGYDMTQAEKLREAYAQ